MVRLRSLMDSASHMRASTNWSAWLFRSLIRSYKTFRNVSLQSKTNTKCEKLIWNLWLKENYIKNQTFLRIIQHFNSSWKSNILHCLGLLSQPLSWCGFFYHMLSKLQKKKKPKKLDLTSWAVMSASISWCFLSRFCTDARSLPWSSVLSICSTCYTERKCQTCRYTSKSLQSMNIYIQFQKIIHACGCHPNLWVLLWTHNYMDIVSQCHCLLWNKLRLKHC